ncbi:MAG: DUF1501 domain-containing protein [Microthrixaceae bacterium]|nr:DUF1501 domain-containing protein [Microthrixaceae bacterium]
MSTTTSRKTDRSPASGSAGGFGTTTRRRFIAGSAAGAAAGVVAMPLVAPGSAAAAPYNGNTLVSMFLRGGCDGLALFPPVGHPAYYDARPTVAVPEGAALALGGPGAHPDFAWHPAAVRLGGLYNSGRVAVVPSAGSPDHSRSHFDCQDGIDAGVPDNRHSVHDGWLGRFLSSTSSEDHPLRAFSAGTGLAPSMRGYGGIAAPSLDQLGLISWGPDPEWALEMIAAGYTPERAGGDLAMWSGVTLGALDELAPVVAAGTALPDGWPTSSVGRLFYTLARLLEEGLPVQAATLDVGGWDHHDEMGSPTNPNHRTHRQVTMLDEAIGAFMDRMDSAGMGGKVTLVTMTEFGRRVAENDSGGADHGYGSPMIVVGGGAVPGVHGEYPGIAPADLDNGDLAVTVDQRAVLSELLAKRLGASNLAGVFPGFDTGAAGHVGVAT